MKKEDIRVRFTEEQAKDILNDIKNKICEVDLDEICGDSTVEAKDKETEPVYRKIIQGVRCGLVEWDEEKNCLVQHLIKEIKSGTMSRADLYFRNKLKFGVTKNYNGTSNGVTLIKSLSEITACPIQLIEELEGQDLTIAIGLMGFFDK